MLGKAQPVTQVLRGHLYGGLADGMGDLGYRVGSRLDDEDASAGARAVDLERERQGSNATPDDADVVICRHFPGVGESRLDLAGKSFSGFRTHLRQLRLHVHA